MLARRPIACYSSTSSTKTRPISAPLLKCRETKVNAWIRTRSKNQVIAIAFYEMSWHGEDRHQNCFQENGQPALAEGDAHQNFKWASLPSRGDLNGRTDQNSIVACQIGRNGIGVRCIILHRCC